MRKSASCWSRRELLARSGLAAGLVPLLSAGRAFAAPVFPKRLIILQWTNGYISDSFWPKSGGEKDFVLNTETAPLEPHRNEIILVRGLGMQNQRDDGKGDAGNPFSGYGGHGAHPYMLTGSSSAVGDGGHESFPVANTISLDQHVANAYDKKTSIRSLELGGVFLDGNDGQRSISFRGPAIPYAPNRSRPQENRPELNPRTVFERLMAAGGGAPVDAATLAKLRSEKKSILDAVLRDAERLKKRVGTDDRAAIENHLGFVRQLEGELGALNAASCGVFPEPAAAITGTRADGPRIDKVVKAQIDLTIAAMKCDITRVATIMTVGPANNLISFPFLGPEFQGGALHKDTGSAPSDILSHHEMAHNGGRDANDPDRKRKVRVDTWFVEQFAYILAQLKKVPEGGGTMMDNTIVLFVNNMNNGGAHSVNDLPWIVAGSGQGQLKTGRFVKLSSDGWTPHNALLLAVAEAMGAPAPVKDGKKYFGDPRYAVEAQAAAIRG